MNKRKYPESLQYIPLYKEADNLGIKIKSYTKGALLEYWSESKENSGFRRFHRQYDLLSLSTLFEALENLASFKKVYIEAPNETYLKCETWSELRCPWLFLQDAVDYVTVKHILQQMQENWDVQKLVLNYSLEKKDQYFETQAVIKYAHQQGLTFRINSLQPVTTMQNFLGMMIPKKECKWHYINYKNAEWRLKLIGIVALGLLQNSNHKFNQFLQKGVYDPRVLLYVTQFLHQSSCHGD